MPSPRADVPAARALEPSALVASLGARVRETVASVVPAGRACALVAFPHHGNVGDHAIWLGQLACLRSLGARVVYATDVGAYEPRDLARSLGEGVILLSGGGSFGDVWPRSQRFLEGVIGAFPQTPIVQLPQTIHFSGAENLDRARRVVDAHPDLALIARDRRSLALAHAELGARSLLCPDMAFALGALPRTGPPVTDILWLARADIEARAQARPRPAPDVRIADWLEEPRSLLRELVRIPHRLPPLRARLRPLAARLYERLAWRRVRLGCSLLSLGRVVVTDRLHGHILSLLLGIPHVLLDNSYGKVRAFHETWTRGSPLTRWADSADEALATARAWLRERGPDEGVAR